MDKNFYELELLIAKILRYGVIIAGLVIFAGWMSEIHWMDTPFVEFHQYSAKPLADELPRLVSGSHWGTLTAYVGLIMLVALPFLRVFMTAVLFLKQREFVLAAVAGIVMFGLLLSFSLGFRI